ncbi:MAG: hypothetical protein SGBAC_013145, partial [Bacillariaceae sp.]
MSTIQRLTETDVRGIFDSIHGGHQPPENLQFQIVPVGTSGLKLSPPAIEFECGLYVLLCPEKPNRPKPRVPPHLHHYVIKDIPGLTCPWSLSGPQFPQPTELQQRYCYPKGNPVYSSQKGGALWTLYDNNGKEDLNYRLLHVYFSAKRAGIRSATPSPARRRRRVTTPTSASSSASSRTAKSPSTPGSNVVSGSPWPPHGEGGGGGVMPSRSYWHHTYHHHHHHPHHPQYPNIPATLVHPTPPPMRPVKHYLPPPQPPSEAFKRCKFHNIPTPPPTRSMMTPSVNSSTTTGAAAAVAAATTNCNNSMNNDTGVGDESVENAAKMPTLMEEDDDAWWMPGGTVGGGPPMLEAPELGLLDHEDEMTLRTKLSFEMLPLATMEDSRMDNLFFLLDSEEQQHAAARAKMGSPPPPLDLTASTTLRKRLVVMHHQLLEWIKQQPKDKQPRLHQMAHDWAEKLQSDLQLQLDEQEEGEGATKLAATDRNQKKQDSSS